MTLSRRLMGEFLGTALLLAAVVGSGIMGERLRGGNVAIALLANTIATGATLTTLIFTFGPISGAHFNPTVTLADATQGGISWREVPGYIAAQIVGASRLTLRRSPYSYSRSLAPHDDVHSTGLTNLLYGVQAPTSRYSL